MAVYDSEVFTFDSHSWHKIINYPFFCTLSSSSHPIKSPSWIQTNDERRLTSLFFTSFSWLITSLTSVSSLLWSSSSQTLVDELGECVCLLQVVGFYRPIKQWKWSMRKLRWWIRYVVSVHLSCSHWSGQSDTDGAVNALMLPRRPDSSFNSTRITLAGYTGSLTCLDCFCIILSFCWRLMC